MVKLKDFIRHNERSVDRLNLLADPLKVNFGVDVIWYVSIREEGQLSAICNYGDAFEQFWENDFYHDMNFFVKPAHLNSGAVLLNDDADYVNYMNSTKQEYPFHHPLLLIKKESRTKAHLFGFASKKRIAKLPSLYLNHIPIFKRFSEYFLESNQKHQQQLDDAAVDIGALLGDAFHLGFYNQEESINPKRCSQLLQAIGEDPFLLSAALKLSKREKQVILASTEGKTAAQVGEELNLSSRTIEYYLENAKDKLGFFTKAELIRFGNVLKIAGLSGS